MTSVKAMIQRLSEVKSYLVNVINKRITPNPLIVSNIQEIFNFLPNFETEDIIKSLSNQTNDNYLILYLGSLVKTIISLHKLINNKHMITEEEKNPPKEKETDKKKEENKENVEKETKENKEKNNKDSKNAKDKK